MPWYELWIEEEDQTLPSVNARDPGEAVSMYSEQLGLDLTLEDEGVGIYGGLRVSTQTEARFVDRRPTISVWIKGAR
jgi:hypothetical protein